MTILTFILTTIVISVIAVVYSRTLTMRGMALNWWYAFLFRHIGDKPYLFNPLIDCPKCVGGQIALWYYLIKYWDCYNFETHISLVFVTIFLSLIVYKVHEWANN